jgi:Inositol polyphosphate kinase
MQVWDATTKSYMFQDKYYGRDLRVGKDFKKALTRYITSTEDSTPRVLTRHIPIILSKLKQLGTPTPSLVLILDAIVQTLPQYRFYATSLLFLYDGATPDEISFLDEDDPSGIKYNPDLRVKIVDFAHAITDLTSPDVVNAPFPPSHRDQPDWGYLKGLKSLKRYFVEYGTGWERLIVGFGRKMVVMRDELRIWRRWRGMTRTKRGVMCRCSAQKYTHGKRSLKCNASDNCLGAGKGDLLAVDMLGLVGFLLVRLVEVYPCVMEYRLLFLATLNLIHVHLISAAVKGKLPGWGDVSHVRLSMKIFLAYAILVLATSKFGVAPRFVSPPITGE